MGHRAANFDRQMLEVDLYYNFCIIVKERTLLQLRAHNCITNIRPLLVIYFFCRPFFCTTAMRAGGYYY